MYTDFLAWLEARSQLEMGGAGTPAVDSAGDGAFKDANIMGAKKNGQPHAQKSADWFKPVPKVGTPAGPKGFKEMAGGGIAVTGGKCPKDANVWGATSCPQHSKKLKRG